MRSLLEKEYAKPKSMTLLMIFTLSFFNMFVACDLVTWLVEKHGSRDREYATRLASKLAAEGYILPESDMDTDPEEKKKEKEKKEKKSKERERDKEKSDKEQEKEKASTKENVHVFEDDKSIWCLAVPFHLPHPFSLPVWTYSSPFILPSLPRLEFISHSPYQGQFHKDALNGRFIPPEPSVLSLSCVLLVTSARYQSVLISE